MSRIKACSKRQVYIISQSKCFVLTLDANSTTYNITFFLTLNDLQIGSYFGAELCSVDIDSNGDTDFLLVGAPLFYHPQEKSEGQIYVYTLDDEVGDVKNLKSQH